VQKRKKTKYGRCTKQEEGQHKKENQRTEVLGLSLSICLQPRGGEKEGKLRGREGRSAGSKGSDQGSFMVTFHMKDVKGENAKKDLGL